jgi:hypothetical protein
MPITNTVSLNEVVSSASLALGMDDNDRYKVVFYDWAYQALSDIGLMSLNITNSTGAIITSPFNHFPIPGSCVYIDSIAIRKGANGPVCYPIFDSNYWVSVPDDDQTMYDKDYVVSRQGSNLIFSSTIIENGFTEVILRYYAIPIDANGSPLIPEFYMRAIMAYIEYMYVKSQRHKDRSSVPLSEIQLFYQQWLSLKSDAISRRNKPEKPEIEAAIAQWITMLPNQRRLMRESKNNV